MKKTITKRAVDALKPGEIIFDDKLVGFVARRLPSGRVTFGFRTTLDGKGRWLALGVGIAPEAARMAAQAHAGAVAKANAGAVGRDQHPVAKREAPSARTVDDILDGYVRARVTGLRTESEIASLLDRLVRPRIGTRPVDALRRRELIELLDGIAESKGARTADKTLSLLRSALNWHALRDDDFVSPIVAGMARLSFKDLTRDRVLSDDEIRSLWLALDSFQPESYSRLVRALLLTACRRSELADLQWSEIKDDVAIVPSARTKTKIDHAVPLTREMAALIGKPPDAGDFVFSASHGAKPFGGFSKAKRRLDAAINEQRARDGQPGMAPWRLHDLRRTARSLMGRAGVPTDHAERALGHALPQIRGVYDRHDYLAEKLAALERLAALLERILDPAPANVVNIAARG